MAGLDHLLLEGASVWVTLTPLGEDANAILQTGGTAALAELLANTCPAGLSIDGEFIRLSRLDRVNYDRERKPMAERLGIRLPTLDHEVRRRRGPGPGLAAPRAAAEEDDPGMVRQVFPAGVDQALPGCRGAIVQREKHIVNEQTLNLCHGSLLDPANEIQGWFILTALKATGQVSLIGAGENRVTACTHASGRV